MIASLSGTVSSRDERSLVVDVHGVGLRVFCISRGLDQSPVGTTVMLHTYLHVREDALELFGFATAGELRLFEKLLTVSGVGPRVAQGVLSAASVADLESAISRGDASVLTNVSGVGTKTAQRIIVDLRGKLDLSADGGDSELASMIEALTRLGYSAKEARDAAAPTDPAEPLEKRIAAALRRLGK